MVRLALLAAPAIALATAACVAAALELGAEDSWWPVIAGALLLLVVAAAYGEKEKAVSCGR